jgi:hypothetical protein
MNHNNKRVVLATQLGDALYTRMAGIALALLNKRYLGALLRYAEMLGWMTLAGLRPAYLRQLGLPWVIPTQRFSKARAEMLEAYLRAFCHNRDVAVAIAKLDDADPEETHRKMVALWVNAEAEAHATPNLM